MIQCVLAHPIVGQQPVLALSRIAAWQIRTRLWRDVDFAWIDGAQLVVSRGMPRATENVYYGLHHFAGMGFLLHFLRPTDLFLDIGADVGSYSVLAGKCCGARIQAVETDPEKLARLRRNLAINQLIARSIVHQVALGAACRAARLPVGFSAVGETMNEPREKTQSRPALTMDALLGGDCPAMIHVDAKLFEAPIFEGAARTFANPALRAIHLREVDTELAGRLVRLGFERFRYDPMERHLRPFPHQHQGGNVLYIREIEKVRQRLKTAPVRTVFGVRV